MEHLTEAPVANLLALIEEMYNTFTGPWGGHPIITGAERPRVSADWRCVSDPRN